LQFKGDDFRAAVLRLVQQFSKMAEIISRKIRLSAPLARIPV
jgi:hypothetical protein